MPKSIHKIDDKVLFWDHFSQIWTLTMRLYSLQCRGPIMIPFWNIDNSAYFWWKLDFKHNGIPMERTLQLLNSVNPNSGLRISTGAFRLSRAESPYVYLEEFPLQHWRAIISINHFSRIIPQLWSQLWLYCRIILAILISRKA